MSSQHIEELIKTIQQEKKMLDKERGKKRRLIVIGLMIFFLIAWAGETLLMRLGSISGAGMLSGIEVEILGAFITFMIIETVWTDHESERDIRLQIMSYATRMALKRQRYDQAIEKCHTFSKELKHLKEEGSPENKSAMQVVLADYESAIAHADRLDEELMEARDEYKMYIQIYYPELYANYLKQEAANQKAG